MALRRQGGVSAKCVWWAWRRRKVGPAAQLVGPHPDWRTDVPHGSSCWELWDAREKNKRHSQTKKERKKNYSQTFYS